MPVTLQQKVEPGNDEYTTKLDQAERLLIAGQLQEVEPIVAELLLQDERNPRANLIAGIFFKLQGRSADAKSILRPLSERDSSVGAIAKLHLCEILLRGGEVGLAIETFEALKNSKWTSNQDRHAAARVLNELGYRHDANEQIRALLRFGEATLEELRCLAAPERAYFPFATKPGVESIPKFGLLNVARCLHSEGDIRDAVEIIRESEELADGNPVVVAYWGQLLLESQQFDLLDEWVASTESKLQRYPSYWLAVGGWAMRRKDFTSAVRCFAEAICREPASVSAHDQLALAFAGLGDLQNETRFRSRATEVESALLQTRKVIESPVANWSDVVDLTVMLRGLDRPFEAICWAKLGAQRFGLSADHLTKIETARQNELRTESSTSSLKSRLCGIEIDRYALKIDDVIAAELGSKKSKGGIESAKLEMKCLPPKFVNVAEQTGIHFLYRNSAPPIQRAFRIYEAYGAGIAAIDYDQDGAVDFYLGQGAADLPDGPASDANELFRNLRGRFQSVGAETGSNDFGYTFGVTSGDINQDGFPDIVVGNMGENTILINQGDGTFVSHAPGTDSWRESYFTASVAIADVSGDNVPDVIEVNYLDDKSIYEKVNIAPNGVIANGPRPLQFIPAVDRVFVSDRQGDFISQKLGDGGSSDAATGLGLVVTDIDDDGKIDLYIANDLMPNFYWKPTFEKDSAVNSLKFIDQAVAKGVAIGNQGMPLGSMGIASADFDGNGLLDLHVTNFYNQWSNHYIQRSDSGFNDQALPSQLDTATYPMVGFGVEALDYDNNSTIDLVIGNGHIEDIGDGSEFRMPTQIFSGNGTTFEQMNVDGDPYWNRPHLARSLITCDWNRDGRIDVAVSDLLEPFVLLENRTQSQRNKWIQLRLVGTETERDAIGTRVQVSYTLAGSSRMFTQFVTTGDGYMCRNEPILSFGGETMPAGVDISIRWTSGMIQEISNVLVNHRYLIVEGDDAVYFD
ncbi:FG-GAP-like repeat-containing protein [Stieleria varia]|uniref:FG-GAP repeat protein n=1 Tax=Stieleria varia TaxID=2528005 RepID=A0A5C6A234_9BACT|nr:FG-GAP-like repeat-containing protein [Stieleria varia]TWT93291.1 FG-GAP repeat protein [Stieleria varia]